MYACIEGQFEIAELLLKNRAQLTINKADRQGMTALAYATAGQHGKLSKLLIEKGNADATMITAPVCTNAVYLGSCDMYI